MLFGCFFLHPKLYPVYPTMQNMMDICIYPRLCFRLLKFPGIGGYLPVRVHRGEGVALNRPSVQTLKELRGEAQRCGAFLAPGLVYLCPGFKRNVMVGKQRQKPKSVAALGEEPLLLQPVPQS